VEKFDPKAIFGIHYTPKSKRANKSVVVLPNGRHLHRKIHHTEDTNTPYVKIRRVKIAVELNDKKQWCCLHPLENQTWPSTIDELGW
jgi:hypothetical protein